MIGNTPWLTVTGGAIRGSGGPGSREGAGASVEFGLGLASRHDVATATGVSFGSSVPVDAGEAGGREAEGAEVLTGAHPAARIASARKSRRMTGR
jgi:hypothetical protein